MIKVKIGDLPPAFQNMASSHCGGNAESLPTMMNMVPIQSYQTGMSLGNFANSNYQLGAIGAPSTFTSNVFGGCLNRRHVLKIRSEVFMLNFRSKRW